MREPEQPIDDILIEAAKAGGEVLLSFYKTPLTITQKSSKRDVSTQADIKSQAVIIETLIKLMAENGIDEDEIGFICEENYQKQGKHTFIVDPLDGTSSFVEKLPSFTVSIGYAVDGKILAGVIYHPINDTIYSAEKGKGAFVIQNGKKTKMAIQEKKLKESRVYYTLGSNQQVIEELLKRLSHLAPHVLSVQRSRASTFTLMEMVKNTVQIVISGWTKIWDIAAAKLIVEEAGGKITDWSGKEFTYDYSNPMMTYPIIASSPKLIAEVVKNFPTKPSIAIVGSMSHSFATYPNGIKERYAGGTSNGGKAAAALGIPAIIIAIGAQDIELGLDSLKKLGIKTIRINRDVSNNFSDDYRTKKRKLRLRSFFTEPFSSKDFKERINCDAVIFFPGLHEISAATISEFNTQLVFLDVAGLSRIIGEKDNKGLYPVLQGHWKSIDEFRNRVDILKVSQEDLENIKFPKGVNSEMRKMQNLAENGFPIVLLTRGEKTTILARKDLPIKKIPTHRITHADPAGAGEVFSVGFVIEYLLRNDAVKAVAFGNACASFKIAGENYDYEKAKQRAEEILATIIS